MKPCGEGVGIAPCGYFNHNIIYLCGKFLGTDEKENTFKLLFRCKFEFEEKNFSDFKSALDNSLNQIEIKVGFKNKSGEIIDNDDLYEGVSDIPTKAQIL